MEKFVWDARLEGLELSKQSTRSARQGIEGIIGDGGDGGQGDGRNGGRAGHEPEVERLRRRVEELESQLAELASPNGFEVPESRVAERTRIFFDYSPIGVSIASPSKREVMRNRAFAEMIGHEIEELTRRSWDSLIHPDDRAMCRAAFADAIERKSQGFQLDVRLLCKEGHAIDVHSITSIQWDEDGRPDHLISTIEDVSQHRRVEREIAAREARYRAVAESAFDLVGEVDDEGRLVYVSDSVRRIFGHSPERFSRLDWMQGVHGDDRELIEEKIACLIADGRVDPFVHRQRHDDGHWCWLETSARRYRTGSGRLHTVFSSRDLSDRYRMEAELHRRAAFIEGIIDHMPALVFQLDEKGRLIDAAGSIMQRNPRIGPDLVGLRGIEIDPESRSFVDRALAGEAISFESSGQHDGAPWNFLVYLAPDADRGAGALGFALNVTPLRDAERRARQAERLSALGTLAAGIAHEINNPIGSVLMAADFARHLVDDGDGGAQTARALDDIVREARRCGEIVRSLLCYAGHEAGGREVVDSNELVRSARDVEMARAEEIGARIDLDLMTEPVWVEVDRTGMTQVIANLIRNALQSNPDGGRVEVSTHRDGPHASISVRDHGRGMSAADLRRAFDPFFTTHRAMGGTGLGLALADAMVTEHGGSIRAESRVGEGSCFVIELPLGSRAEGET